MIAAAGSDHKCNLALQKGATHSVNYSQNSLKDEVKKLTDNRGVNVAIDAVGGDIFKQALHRCVEVRFALDNLDQDGQVCDLLGPFPLVHSSSCML